MLTASYRFLFAIKLISPVRQIMVSLTGCLQRHKEDCMTSKLIIVSKIYKTCVFFGAFEQKMLRYFYILFSKLCYLLFQQNRRADWLRKSWNYFSSKVQMCIQLSYVSSPVLVQACTHARRYVYHPSLRCQYAIFFNVVKNKKNTTGERN